MDADEQGGRRWAVVRVADDLEVTTYDTGWSVGEAHYLYHEVFTHDDYLRDVPALRPDCLVVDAGANIGMFGIRIARAYPAARLVAIEPVPGTCALLRRNLADAGVANAVVHQVAAGAADGRLTLTAYRHLTANSTSRPEEKPAAWLESLRAVEPERVEEMAATERHEVDVRPLSALLPPDGPVDLLKIDVEGAELDVLRGVAPGDWPRLRHVVAEVHDVDGRLAAVLQLLRGRGFTCSTRVPAMMSADLDHHLVSARRG